MLVPARLLALSPSRPPVSRIPPPLTGEEAGLTYRKKELGHGSCSACFTPHSWAREAQAGEEEGWSRSWGLPAEADGDRHLPFASLPRGQVRLRPCCPVLLSLPRTPFLHRSGTSNLTNLRMSVFSSLRVTVVPSLSFYNSAQLGLLFFLTHVSFPALAVPSASPRAGCLCPASESQSPHGLDLGPLLQLRSAVLLCGCALLRGCPTGPDSLALCKAWCPVSLEVLSGLATDRTSLQPSWRDHSTFLSLAPRREGAACDLTLGMSLRSPASLHLLSGRPILTPATPCWLIPWPLALALISHGEEAQ